MKRFTVFVYTKNKTQREKEKKKMRKCKIRNQTPWPINPTGLMHSNHISTRPSSLESLSKTNPLWAAQFSLVSLFFQLINASLHRTRNQTQVE